jgi:hypothetical protein
LSHSRCAFSRIFEIFLPVLPHQPLSHMKKHIVFGAEWDKHDKNLSNLL